MSSASYDWNRRVVDYVIANATQKRSLQLAQASGSGHNHGGAFFGCRFHYCFSWLAGTFTDFSIDLKQILKEIYM